MTPNYHIIFAKYAGPTNSRGSRVILTSERFGEKKVIDYDHRMNNIWEMAEDWLRRYGFHIVGHGETKNGAAIITSTFMGLKNIRPAKASGIKGPRATRAAKKSGRKPLSKRAFLARMAAGRKAAARRRR